jgi:hypothetical protein
MKFGKLIVDGIRGSLWHEIEKYFLDLTTCHLPITTTTNELVCNRRRLCCGLPEVDFVESVLDSVKHDFDCFGKENLGSYERILDYTNHRYNAQLCERPEDLYISYNDPVHTFNKSEVVYPTFPSQTVKVETNSAISKLECGKSKIVAGIVFTLFATYIFSLLIDVLFVAASVVGYSHVIFTVYGSIHVGVIVIISAVLALISTVAAENRILVDVVVEEASSYGGAPLNIVQIYRAAVGTIMEFKIAISKGNPQLRETYAIAAV